MKTSQYILLVEDNTNDATLFLREADRQGFTAPILHIRDGAEALDFLQQTGKYCQRRQVDPTVIVLDIRLPKVNGLELLQKIKGDPKLKAIPVMVFTTSESEPEAEETLRLGANCILKKPIEFKEYAEAVTVILTFWEMIIGSSSRIDHTNR